MNYMNLMNSNNIILPKELIPYFRSNHAGETGAVYIYKYASGSWFGSGGANETKLEANC